MDVEVITLLSYVCMYVWDCCQVVSQQESFNPCSTCTSVLDDSPFVDAADHQPVNPCTPKLSLKMATVGKWI